MIVVYFLTRFTQSNNFKLLFLFKKLTLEAVIQIDDI